MGPVNRYQILGAIALVVFLFGLVRATKILLSPAGAGRETAFSLAPVGQISLTLPQESSFPKLPESIDRDPFLAPSPWRAPQPEALPPPPVTDLLSIEPTPFLFRPDGVPRLGGVAHSPQNRADTKILMRVRRAFRSSAKEVQR